MARAPRGGRYRVMSAGRSALIVASHTYEDPKLRQLRAPAHDAEELAHVLADPEIGGFDVEVLLNEPEGVARRKIVNFFKNRNRDDLLLLHFSCHGVKDDEGHLYFATPDTEMDSLDATAVSTDFVERQIERTRSRRLVLLLDCCYSGAFARGTRHRAGEAVDLRERFEGRGRAVITASSAMEYSFEGDELSGAGSPSIFTHALVDGLRSGEADRDEDGLISVDELYDHIYEQVRERTPKQTPGKWSDVEGQLIIARSPRPVIVRPAELPSDLREAMENRLAGVREGAVKELGGLLRGSHAGLSLAARMALEHLREDDSRRVSQLAESMLLGEGATAPPAEPALPGVLPSLIPSRPQEETPAEVAAVPPPVEAAPPPPVEAKPSPVEMPPPAAAPKPIAAAPRAQTEPRTSLAPALWLAAGGAVLNLGGAAVASTRTAFLKDDVSWSQLETIMVPLAMLGAIAAAGWSPRLRGYAIGLVLGFAIVTTFAYLAFVLGGEPLLRGPRTAPLVPLVGAVLVGAGALLAYKRARNARQDADFAWLPSSRPLVVWGPLGGAVLIVAALFLPFSRGADTSIRSAEPWLTLEPGVAAACLVAVALALRAPRGPVLLLAGVATAVGVQMLLFFVFFVGFQLSVVDFNRWLISGPVGLVGAALAVVAGWAAARERAAPAGDRVGSPVVLAAALVGVLVALFGQAAAGMREPLKFAGLAPVLFRSLWEQLETVGAPAVMLLALAALVWGAERRDFAVGVLAGFAIVSAAAYGGLAAAGGSFVSDWFGVSSIGVIYAVAPLVGMSIVAVAAFMLVNRLVPSSSDAPLPRRLAKRLGAGAGAGAVCVAVALVLPLGGFLSEEIDSVRELNKWLLVAPLVAVGVAVVAAAALYRSSVRRYLWSGVLVGVGLEMFLFFLGLIGETLSREPFQRPGGGHLGLVGAGLLVACGTLALRGHEPATAVAPEEAPPAAVATP